MPSRTPLQPLYPSNPGLLRWERHRGRLSEPAYAAGARLEALLRASAHGCCVGRLRAENVGAKREEAAAREALAAELEEIRSLMGELEFRLVSQILWGSNYAEAARARGRHGLLGVSSIAWQFRRALERLATART